MFNFSGKMLYAYIVYYNRDSFCKSSQGLQDVSHVWEAQGGNRVHVGIKHLGRVSGCVRLTAQVNVFLAGKIKILLRIIRVLRTQLDNACKVFNMMLGS